MTIARLGFQTTPGLGIKQSGDIITATDWNSFFAAVETAVNNHADNIGTLFTTFGSYYNKTEVDTLLSGKANAVHTHAQYLTDASSDSKVYGRKNGSWVEVMNSVYWDNIQNKPSTFTPSVHNHNDLYYGKTAIDTALSGKQATLVSGSNIKSINDSSILGSGNLTISTNNIVNVTHNTSTGVFTSSHTYASVLALINSGHHVEVAYTRITPGIVGSSTVIMQYNNRGLNYIQFTGYMSNGYVIFSMLGDTDFNVDYVSYIYSSYKVSSWSVEPTNTNVPSEKLVKDSLDEKQDVLTAGMNIDITNGVISASGTVSTDWNYVTNKPVSYTPSAHNHNDLYYTETETNALFNYTGCTLVDTQIVTGVTKTYAGYEIRYYPSLKIYTIRLAMSIAIDSGTTIPVGTRIRVGSIKRGGSYISDVFMQTLAACSLAGTSSDVNLYGAYIDSNGNVYIYCNVALTNGTKHIGINGIISAEE